MNDAELTMFAAKAFGDAPAGFSPLTDDGDALRLAARLKISISFEERSAREWKHIVWCEPCFEPVLDSPSAATRRAIVRAAADIELRKQQEVNR